MNKLNMKKLLPGIISVIVIAGMAAQSFATNVDMAAFVDKEKYMTKYYELDWRIDQIENRLINLYQYTCTNVRTFGGAGYNNNGGIEATRTNAILMDYNTSTLQNLGYVGPSVILKEQKYLKVNTPTAINANQSVAPSNHTQVLKKSIPASVCWWMNGIEPAENCMINITGQMIYNNGGGMARGFIESYGSVIMGPFKKFKYPTTAGTSGIWLRVPKQYGMPGVASGYQTRNTASYPTDLQYAENSLTEPTSWTNLTTANSRPYSAAYTAGSTSVFPVRDYDEYPSTAFYPEKGSSTFYALYWNSALPTVSLEGKENVWLRFIYLSTVSSDGSYPTTVAFGGGNTVFTSWNNNK